jgi:hypothetical protein
MLHVCPFRSSCFYHPNNVGWAVQNKGLIIIISPLVLYYLVPSQSKCLAQHHTPSAYVPPSTLETNFLTPTYKTADVNTDAQSTYLRKALRFKKQDKIVNTHIILSEGYKDSCIFVTTPVAISLNKDNLPISYSVVWCTRTVAAGTGVVTCGKLRIVQCDYGTLTFPELDPVRKAWR